VRREPDGSLVLPGSFPVHDLPDLGVDLPEGPYATVAGLVLDRLGRIPGGGETVAVGDWLLEVLEVERNTVRRLRLRPRGGGADG
jgi:putative hemolysin